MYMYLFNIQNISYDQWYDPSRPHNWWWDFMEPIVYYTKIRLRWGPKNVSISMQNHGFQGYNMLKMVKTYLVQGIEPCVPCQACLLWSKVDEIWRTIRTYLGFLSLCQSTWDSRTPLKHFSRKWAQPNHGIGHVWYFDVFHPLTLLVLHLQLGPAMAPWPGKAGDGLKLFTCWPLQAAWPLPWMWWCTMQPLGSAGGDAASQLCDHAEETFTLSGKLACSRILHILNMTKLIVDLQFTY